MEGALLSPGGLGCQVTIWALPCSVRWHLYLKQESSCLVSLLCCPASALPNAQSTGSALPPLRVLPKLGSEPQIHKTQSLGHWNCPASMTLHGAPTLELGGTSWHPRPGVISIC